MDYMQPCFMLKQVGTKGKVGVDNKPEAESCRHWYWTLRFTASREVLGS